MNVIIEKFIKKKNQTERPLSPHPPQENPMKTKKQIDNGNQID